MKTYIPHVRRIFLALGIIFAIANVHAADSSGILDRDSVNAFDRIAMFPYSASQDIMGDVTMYSAMLTPAVFLLAAPSEDWAEIGILYAGSAAASFGTGELLKRAFPRDRPYMYYSDPPEKYVDSGDSEKSFPSRHAIMAFNGAGFTAATFMLRYPDSRYKVPAIATAYGLAFATATLRVTGGSHFTSDVITGALIGTATGFLAPYVNFRLRHRSLSVSASPAELAICYRY